MKEPPLTNFDKFEKTNRGVIRSFNYEILFFTGIYSTCHYQVKNFQIEGVKIGWKGNPFDLAKYRYYKIEK